MKQMTLAGGTGFEKLGRPTRKGGFLARLAALVPWADFCALNEPLHSKAVNGRPPVGLERMLRMYFMVNWFKLADAAGEDALYYDQDSSIPSPLLLIVAFRDGLLNVSLDR